MVFRAALESPVRLAAFATLGVIAYATLCPLELRPSLGQPNWERFIAYALAGFLFVLAYPKRGGFVALGLVCAAVSLELGQYIDPSRHPRLADAAIKSLGAVSGAAASLIATRVAASVRKARCFPRNA